MSFLHSFLTYSILTCATFSIGREIFGKGKEMEKNDDILPLKTMYVTDTALILILKCGSQKRFHDIKKPISNGNTMFTDFSFTTETITDRENCTSYWG